MSALPSPPLHAPPMNLTFDSTLGAIVIGEALTAVLFGVTSIQMYIYFIRCEHNGMMKWIMSFLWILDAVHLAFILHSTYYYTVTNFTNPFALFYCPWSFAADMFIGMVSQGIVISIFAERIWKLSGRVWPLILVLPLMLCEMIGVTAIGILARKVPLFSEFQARFSWLWTATFTMSAICDCTITVSLCKILFKRRTGYRGTESVIRTLILYSISTGALTSSVAIASVITYAIMPHNFASFALVMVLPKFMVNSLLALLNSRESRREKISGPISIHLSKLSADSGVPTEDSRRRAIDQVIDIGIAPYKPAETILNKQFADA